MSNGFQKTHKPWQEPENVPQKLRKPQKELQIPNNEGWNKVIKKEV